MSHALTIAGSDSSGGAGIQADLKTFAAFGLHGVSAVTAITAQNTRGVASVAPLSPALVAAQIDAIADDIRIDAVKIGMLGTRAIVEAVVAAIDAHRLRLVVLDPVLFSSSGQRLLDDEGIEALRLDLIPRVSIVTPNVPEAEALSRCRIADERDLRRAAERLHDMGAAAVVITGGHSIASPDASGGDVVDLLFDGTSFVELRTPRVGVGGPAGFHGTGCTYASALAAGLGKGDGLDVAARCAQQYVAGAMAHGRAVGGGALILDHFWRTPLTSGSTSGSSRR